jgi:hypothetical protein
MNMASGLRPVSVVASARSPDDQQRLLSGTWYTGLRHKFDETALKP